MSENAELKVEKTALAEKPAKKPAATKTAVPTRASKPKAPKVSKAKAVLGGAEHDSTRGRRKTREGIVVSNRMAKTVVVMVQRRTPHPLYGKVVIRSNKFKAHDEQSCDIGDRVEIMETRPLSKEKRWRVTQILEKVK
jgi:small subunit ribosomal protein S17